MIKKTSDFREGDLVKYVPFHAHGDENHPDCELGVVSSTNTRFVFVRYGDRPNCKGTMPEDLVLLSRKEGEF